MKNSRSKRASWDNTVERRKSGYMEVKPIEDYVELLSSTENVPLLGKLVNCQPLSSTHPKLKSYPLNELSSPNQGRIQESLVVHDLLNVLVGLEGAYIRYNNKYDPYGDAVPEFKIAKVMDPSLKSFAKRVAKLGKNYIVLSKAAERWSDPLYGVVLQRLGFEIRQFLRLTYLQFIVERLEKDFKEKMNFSIRELEQVLNDAEITKQLELLYAIYERIDKENKARQNMDRMQEDFNNFINDLKDQGELRNGTILATDTRVLPVAKGGVILTILQDMVQENLGDRSSVTFLKSLLNNVAEYYCEMLCKWLSQGELDDPYDEFMIVDTMKHVNDIAGRVRYGDRIWDTQYVIRKDGLLNEFKLQNHEDLLFKILTVGKLWNVIRTSLEVVKLQRPHYTNEEAQTFSDLTEGTNLALLINKWYRAANEACLNMYMNGYQLVSFLIKLQTHYFGYNNSNGITRFLHKNIVELTRRHKNNGNEENKLQRNFDIERKFWAFSPDDLAVQLMNLQLDKQSFEEMILQYAMRDHENGEQLIDQTVSSEDDGERLLKAHNFQNLKDILLRELQPSQNEGDNFKTAYSNIHHLTFEMIVPYPLSIIVTRTCIVQYQIISRYLNLLQYYNMLLDDTWVEINKNKIWTYRGFSDTICIKIIKRCRIIHNQMNQFVKLVLEYFTQDVVEKEMSAVISASNSNHRKIYIADLQTLLQEGLTNIMTNCCLSQLIEIQLQIFEIIHKFCKFITSLRRQLCQMDSNLYATYFEGLTNGGKQDGTLKAHNHEEASKLVPELIAYINMVSQGFDQHIVAFKEGLRHYCNSNRTRDSSGEDNHNTARLLYALGF